MQHSNLTVSVDERQELTLTNTRTGAVMRYNYEALARVVKSKRGRADYEQWLGYLLHLERALGIQR